MSRRRQVVIGGAVVAALVLVVLLGRPATVLADAACGDAPDWWNAVAWIQWESCEVANGGASAPITQIVSPILNDISTGISGLAGGISSLPGGIAGALTGSFNSVTNAVNAIVSFVTPQSGDFDPIIDAMNDILATKQPFALINAVAADVTQLRDTLTSAVPGGGVSGPTVIGGYDFGPLYGGVEDFLWFLDQCGMPASVWSGLFSSFIVLTTVWSILADLGVRTGTIEPGSSNEVYEKGATVFRRGGRTFVKHASSLRSRRYS